MKRKLMLIAAVLAGVLGLATLSAPVVKAEEGEGEIGTNSLRLSPSGTRLSLTAGTILQGQDDGCVSSLSDGCSVQVFNPGKEAFRYKVYVTPYSVVGSNNELSFTEAEGSRANYTQIARWIEVQNTDGEFVKEATFTINPGETQTLQYRVVIPDDIPGGSQYAVIWAQIINDTPSTSGIQTVGQVGTVVTGRSASATNEAANISNVDMTRFAFNGPMRASAKVANEGNTDFVISYTYTAKTFFGKEVFRTEDTIAAYPETDYDVNVEWEETPLLGIFRAEFIILAAGEEHVESHIIIIMPLVVLILLILLLTIIIVWIIIIIRKRKERKARKLV